MRYTLDDYPEPGYDSRRIDIFGNETEPFDDFNGDDSKTADMMRDAVLFGSPFGTGFMTNPRTPDQPWIEVNSEKVVCLAKGGECRSNPMFYTGSLNSSARTITTHQRRTSVASSTTPNTISTGDCSCGTARTSKDWRASQQREIGDLNNHF